MAPQHIAGFDGLPFELKARIAYFLDHKADQGNFRLIQRRCSDLTIPALFNRFTMYMFQTDLERLESVSHCPKLAERVRHIEFEVAHLPKFASFDQWERHIKDAACFEGPHDGVGPDPPCKYDQIREIHKTLSHEGIRARYLAYVEGVTNQETFTNSVDTDRLTTALQAFSGLKVIEVNSGGYSVFSTGLYLHKLECATLVRMQTSVERDLDLNFLIHVQILSAIHVANMKLESFHVSEMPIAFLRESASSTRNHCDANDFKHLRSLRLLTAAPTVREILQTPIDGKGAYECFLQKSNQINAIALGGNGHNAYMLREVRLRDMFPSHNRYWFNLSSLDLRMIRLRFDDLVTALARLKVNLTNITLCYVFLVQKDWISVFQFLATTMTTKVHFDQLWTERGVWDTIPCNQAPCHGQVLPKDTLFVRMWEYLQKGSTQCPLQSLEENEKAELQWVKQSDRTMRYHPRPLHHGAFPPLSWYLNEADELWEEGTEWVEDDWGDGDDDEWEDEGGREDVNESDLRSEEKGISTMEDDDGHEYP